MHDGAAVLSALRPTLKGLEGLSERGGGGIGEKFEEVHGEESHRRALMEVEEAIARGATELHELIPELSAPPPAGADQ